MKTHILRAPQTDRYGLQVPTLISDLEDDTETPLLILSTAASLTDPSSVAPLVSDTTVSNNVGFTLPTSGDLTITIPETGLYAFSLQATWNSEVTSGGMVGRSVTYFDMILSSWLAPTAQFTLTFDGNAGRDNKLGPIVILDSAGAEQYLSLNLSTLTYATAGDVLVPGFSGTFVPSVPGAMSVTALLSAQIVRIA